MGYRSLEWNWPKEAMNRPIGAGKMMKNAKLFEPLQSWLTSIDKGCTHQGSWGP